MKEQEKDKREQEKLGRWHKGRTKFQTIMWYIMLIGMGGVSLINIIRYLLMDTRTTHDNEQLSLGVMMFIASIAIWLFFDKFNCLERLIDWANRSYKNNNLKKEERIRDLDSALYALDGKSGLLAWEMIWGIVAIFFIIIFLAYLDTVNKGVIIGGILFSLVMLFGGHMLAPKIAKRKFYDRKLFKYSRMYIDYPSHEEYRMQIAQSISRGVLSYTGCWLLTDEFMLCRLEDVTFKPVAIPRNEIERIFFFYEKRHESSLVGILQLRLKNGKVVELRIGWGAQDMSEYTLWALQENGIEWTLEKIRNA